MNSLRISEVDISGELTLPPPNEAGQMTDSLLSIGVSNQETRSRNCSRVPAWTIQINKWVNPECDTKLVILFQRFYHECCIWEFVLITKKVLMSAWTKNYPNLCLIEFFIIADLILFQKVFFKKSSKSSMNPNIFFLLHCWVDIRYYFAQKFQGNPKKFYRIESCFSITGFPVIVDFNLRGWKSVPTNRSSKIKNDRFIDISLNKLIEIKLNV